MQKLQLSTTTGGMPLIYVNISLNKFTYDIVNNL